MRVRSFQNNKWLVRFTSELHPPRLHSLCVVCLGIGNGRIEIGCSPTAQRRAQKPSSNLLCALIVLYSSHIFSPVGVSAGTSICVVSVTIPYKETLLNSSGTWLRKTFQ
jgi:hypothetical protein